MPSLRKIDWSSLAKGAKEELLLHRKHNRAYDNELDSNSKKSAYDVPRIVELQSSNRLVLVMLLHVKPSALEQLQYGI